MKPDQKRPIAIEDLLRLKRAERPAAEFWSEFDQRLRAKQLAALVEKRPWWRSLPVVFSGVTRHRVAFGTAAAFALTVVVIREVRSPLSVPAGADVPVVAENALLAAQPIAVAEAAPVVVVSTAAHGQPSPIESVTVVDSNDLSRGFAAEIATPAAQLASVADVSVSTKTPVPAAVLSTPEVKSSVRLLASNSVFETKPAPAVRAPIDPLQQMTPPGELRRARFLTAMVAQTTVDSSSRGAERQASRLAEDGAFDPARRFGARGDRVNLKF